MGRGFWIFRFLNAFPCRREPNDALIDIALWEALEMALMIWYHGTAGRPRLRFLQTVEILRRANMYRFYGWEAADVRDGNGLTPRDLYDLLRVVWAADTCAPRMRGDWRAENPTLGQCSVTAFLVQDLFGGNVFGVPLGDGNYHCFNAVGSCVFDLTSEQFGDQALSYADCPEQLREVHFAREEKRQRYRLLRRRLLAEYAVRLKHSGHNCCQAVLCAFAHRTETPAEALRALGAAFGAGMGCLEATCGALIGAQMLLGMEKYRGRPMLRDAAQVHNRFREMCGASICRELKGRDTGVVLCECDDCVRNAVEIAEGLMP